MNTERTPEHNKSSRKGEEYVEEILKSEGLLWNLFKRFNRNKFVRRRKLKVRQTDQAEEDPSVKRVKGYSNRKDTAEFKEGDIEFFNQLAKDIREIPNIKVRYTSDGIEVEEGALKRPTEVNYYISPDWDKFEE